MTKWYQHDKMIYFDREGLEIKGIVESRKKEKRHFTIPEKQRIMAYIDKAR